MKNTVPIKVEVDDTMLQDARAAGVRELLERANNYIADNNVLRALGRLALEMGVECEEVADDCQNNDVVYICQKCGLCGMDGKT